MTGYIGYADRTEVARTNQPTKKSSFFNWDMAANISSHSRIDECSVKMEDEEKDPCVASAVFSKNNCNISCFLRELYNRRGIFLALMAAFGFSLQSVSNSLIHPDVTVLEMAFAQALMQGMFVMPIMVHKDMSPNFKSKPKILGLLSLRGVLGVTGSCLFYYSIRHMSIGDTTAIVLSSPVVSGIFARFFLKEAFGIVEALLVLLSISGVILITQPPVIFTGNELNLLATLTAVGSCISFSLSYIVCRKMTLLNVPNQVILLYYGMVGALFMAVINTAMGSWVIPPCDNTRYFLVSAGTIGCIAQYALTYAFSVERTLLVNIITSNEVLFAYVLEFLLFGVSPDVLVACGAILILFASACTAVRRSKLGTPLQRREKEDENTDRAVSEGEQGEQL